MFFCLPNPFPKVELMRFFKFFCVGLSIGIISYAFGIITANNKLFPYHQVKALKQFIAADVSDDSLPEKEIRDKYFKFRAHTHYNLRKSFFDQHGRQDYDIVFIGDSITEGAEWEDLFPNIKIANRGIGGDTTEGVLKRLDSIYATNASKAFIMIGVNDLASGISVGDMLIRYKKIALKIAAYGIPLYIQSTILTGEPLKDLNGKISELNDHLRYFAQHNQLMTYIDLNHKLAPNLFLDPRYTNDQVHLNGYGYAVWKELIESYVKIESPHSRQLSPEY